MALVPVPGSQLTGPSAAIEAAIPAAVDDLLATLWGAGHAAYVVGGSLRDVVLGRVPADWDLASEALPERDRRALPGRRLREPVRDGRRPARRRALRDHDLPDRPRLRRLPPSASGRVRRLDRSRPGAPRLHGQRDGLGRAAGRDAPRSIDPYGGPLDARARVLRAVGDPATRFEEDALRMVRAVRLATTLEFEVEPDDAGRDPGTHAELVAHLSGERIAAELDKLLAAPVPSVGLRLLARDRAARADLRRARGAARDRPEQGAGRGPVGPHAAGGRRCRRRPAGRPAGGPPPRHRQAGDVRRRPFPRSRRGRGRAGRGVPRPAARAAIRARPGRRAGPPPHVQLRGELVGRGGPPVHRQDAGDSATGSSRTCSRFARRTTSGRDCRPNAGRLDELRARIAAELAAEAVLDRSGLAIDGSDLIDGAGTRTRTAARAHP